MLTTLEESVREFTLADQLAQRADQIRSQAVRDALRAGYSQREIARAIGKSQPEVSRMARFHGSTPLGVKLRVHRSEILEVAARYGLTKVRVFGSVARGDETESSDIDLLVDTVDVPNLFALGRAEAEMSRILGAEVEITPSQQLRSGVSAGVLSEAIPL